MKKLIKISLLILTLMYAYDLSYANAVPKNKLIEYAKKAYLQRLGGNTNQLSCDVKDYFFIGDVRQPSMLVMNFSPGFIILSADDAVKPVLAYSTTTNFYLENAAPGARMLVEQYEEEIEYVKQAGIRASEEVNNKWKELKTDVRAQTKSIIVSPLTTAEWNQSKFYNWYSPIDHDSPVGYDSRVPTGCVATAMGMVLYYYRYPVVGRYSHTNQSEYGDFTVSYSQQYYNYNAMTDALMYYNSEVAKLIFHAATAVDMQYSPHGSGATSSAALYAFTRYFKYASGARLLSKSNLGGAVWRQNLKEELDAKRPLFYTASSIEGGHAFICDGYDSEELFHFNFGWGGAENGFYSANAGGDNPINGFNRDQEAIFYLHPSQSSNYPYYCNNPVLTSASGSLEDGSCYLPYLNNSNCSYVIAPENVQSIEITIKQFETEEGHDSLSFWNGNPQNGNLLLTLSGSMPEQTVYSFNVDSLYVTFVTDEQNVADGWKLTYESSTLINPCHSGIYSETSGTLSDGSGEDNYNYNADCNWKLSVPEASCIKLSFSEFDISPEDGIYVYDLNQNPQELLEVYSGELIPEEKIFNTNNLLISFMSDNYLNAQGFRLNWSTDLSLDIQDNENSYLMVYPNPATSLLNVKLNDSFQNATISVLDATGRVVKTISSSNSSCVTINVSDLNSGIYTLVCSNNNGSIKKKLIIAHK